MNKHCKILYLMCGCPASGKSWYADILADKMGISHLISRDEIRFSLLKDNEDYFSHEDEVFNIFTTQIINALNIEGMCIADATHITRASRNKILGVLTKEFSNLEINIIWMDTSLDTCLKRNAKRTGLAKVPNGIIRRMYVCFEPPTDKEKYKYNFIYQIKEGDKIFS